MFSPWLFIGEIDGVDFKNHTRCVNRKSLSNNAPTGQRSTTFPASGLFTGRPGNTSISSLCPRPNTANSEVPEISRVNRTHRVHMMHRSAYNRICSPTSFFGFFDLSSMNRDSDRPYLYE